MKPVLTVGSVAFDSIEAPSGQVSRIVGGAATYFSLAASFFTDVRLVAVIGEDFSSDKLKLFQNRRIDLTGLQCVPGESFRWKGKYNSDLSARETIYTKLNVFEEFSPQIPNQFRDTPYVFLANIHPALQLQVLEQVVAPQFVALDTMNYWIQGNLEELKEVLAKVNVIIINDEEARDLTGQSSIVKAANMIRALGPKRVIIKRGEHGVLMSHDEDLFAVPGFPLDEVSDPTGAGDTFAGGFVGYLAASDQVTEKTFAEAVIAGSTMASFAVEDFGIDRLLRLTDASIRDRFKAFYKLTHFDPPV